jgi:parallel beta-helix repeat protein
MHTAKLAASLLVLLALVVGAAPARANPPWAGAGNCTAITALPAVITVEGVYCFTGGLSTAMTSGQAIVIQASNVVLDLSGFTLDGLGGGTSTLAEGIRALNLQNITIKNGTIRGFYAGINLNVCGGCIVEDIRADHNRFFGIEVNGSGMIVRNNQVVATGGSTAQISPPAWGIFVQGVGQRVLNNDVISTVGAAGLGTAIFVANASQGALVVNNRITGADFGISFGGGPTSGKLRDNLTFDVTSPFSPFSAFVIDAGNNN